MYSDLDCLITMFKACTPNMHAIHVHYASLIHITTLWVKIIYVTKLCMYESNVTYNDI